MNECAYCREDKARFATTLDAEILIEDGLYAINPSFCSWQHAAAWFNQPPPDITSWRLTRSLKAEKAPAEGGVGTWIVLVVLILMLLGTAVVLGLTLN